MRDSRHAPRRRLPREPPRRARHLPRWRARRRCDRASRLRRIGPAHRRALRRRRRIARHHHLSRPRQRPTDRRHVAHPPLGGGPRAAAGRASVLGRGLVRAHGADARPRGLGAHRLRRLAPSLRPRGPAVRRQCHALLRESARRGSVRGLCHRAAPDRPLDPGPQASRAVPAPRRREGDRRGHRDPRRALHRHLGDHGRLAVRELHHAAGARRRGLCHLARRARRRGGTAAPPAPALRDDRHQRLRLPALRALRRGGHHRRLRRRVRTLGASLRLQERGAGDRAIPRVARPRPGELPVAGALRRQARAPRRTRHEARRGGARRGRRQYAGHARRRHRHALRDLRRAREGGRALFRSSARATRGRIRSTSTRG